MRLWGRIKALAGGRVRKGAALHDAAELSRRLKGWRPSGANINTILQGSGDLILRRSREIVRTNPYAANAREGFASSLIGTGIKPSSLLSDHELRERVQALWHEWSAEADADQATDVYGLQTIIGSALFDAGEIFVRFRPRRTRDGLSVPLQLQLLEAEYCDRSYSMQRPNGNEIRCGIEFSGEGRRVAYHFWRQHPGDATSAVRTLERVRVPARQVLHVFIPQRPGQLRGLPRIVPALVKLFLLDQYDDAELDRKKVAALIAGFITQPDVTEEGEPSAINAKDMDDEGVASAEWQPGTMQILGPGEDIKFSDPADVGGNYESFQYRTLLAVCAAMGLPYTSVTGDMLKVNYSTARAAMFELRRRIGPLQRNVIVHQFCRPVWRRWMETAVLAGALDGEVRELQSKVKWIPPKWEWVDPLKDRQAEKLAVDAGFKARSDVIEAEGADPEEIDQRIAADRARADRLGLSFEEAGETETVEEEEETSTQPIGVAS